LNDAEGKQTASEVGADFRLVKCNSCYVSFLFSGNFLSHLIGSKLTGFLPPGLLSILNCLSLITELPW